MFFRQNTDCLEGLVAEMYARGLSTRDIEDALKDATGDPILSKSSVSKVTEVLWEEYEYFKGMGLSSFEVEYLFLDAVYKSIRRLAGVKEAILVAWAILKRWKRKVRIRCWVHKMENLSSKVPKSLWPPDKDGDNEGKRCGKLQGGKGVGPEIHSRDGRGNTPHWWFPSLPI